MKPVCLVSKYKPAHFRHAETRDRSIFYYVDPAALRNQIDLSGEYMPYILRSSLSSSISAPTNNWAINQSFNKQLKSMPHNNDNGRIVIKSSINPFTYPSNYLFIYLHIYPYISPSTCISLDSNHSTVIWTHEALSFGVPSDYHHSVYAYLQTLLILQVFLIYKALNRGV